MNITIIITAISSILLFMVGADKFLLFMEPPCSLMNGISPTIWKGLGVLQLLGGVLIWMPKYRKYVAGFFIVFMLFFTSYHLMEGTNDVGGAVFMAALLGLLVWSPSFLTTQLFSVGSR